MEHTGLLSCSRFDELVIALKSLRRESAYGVNGTRLVGVAIDSANNRALLSDSDGRCHTCDRFCDRGPYDFIGQSVQAPVTIVQICGVFGVWCSTVDRNRLVLSNNNSMSVMAIDLGSGDRSFVSNSSIGTGPMFGLPYGILDVDPANNRVAMTRWERCLGGAVRRGPGLWRSNDTVR